MRRATKKNGPRRPLDCTAPPAESSLPVPGRCTKAKAVAPTRNQNYALRSRQTTSPCLVHRTSPPAALYSMSTTDVRSAASLRKNGLPGIRKELCASALPILLLRPMRRDYAPYIYIYAKNNPKSKLYEISLHMQHAMRRNYAPYIYIYAKSIPFIIKMLTMRRNYAPYIYIYAKSTQFL